MVKYKKKTKRKTRKRKQHLKKKIKIKLKKTKRETRKKITVKKLNFKKANCSPRKKEMSFTCYTKDSLIKIKNIWNVRHPDNKIKSNKPRKIWEKLHYVFRNTCENESCWLKHACIKEHVDPNIFKNTFAPNAPKEWRKKPTQWLNSLDILKVMKQYEETYSNFEFIGPSPIDYDTHKAYGECVWEELCEFDLSKKIKKNIGIIFNLDPHYKGGSHWVTLFIDNKKREIYYFDSYGDKIPKQILKFANTVKNQGKKMNLNYKIIINKTRHQYSNSECGMYSLYIIIQLLKNKSFNHLMKNKIKDRTMKQLRKKYFNV